MPTYDTHCETTLSRGLPLAPFVLNSAFAVDDTSVSDPP